MTAAARAAAMVGAGRVERGSRDGGLEDVRYVRRSQRSKMARRLAPGGPFSFLPTSRSVGHAERKLQLPRLIEHVGRARRLQVGARRDDAVVVGEVLGVEDVERL